MIKSIAKVLLLLPLITLFTTGWKFEFIDKPGSQYIVEGLQKRDGGDYNQAIAAFEKAKINAIDNRTKAHAMVQIAALTLAKIDATVAEKTKAIAYLYDAEKLDYPRASLLLGRLYQEGEAVAPDYVKAYAYFFKVKDRYSAATLSLAELTQNDANAQSLFYEAEKQLAEDRNPSVQTMMRLANHYQKGDIVAPNSERVVYWLQQAIEQNSMPAVMDLAKYWEASNHQPYSDIINLWQKAANSGNHSANLDLGFAHATGQGVIKDAAMASQYFERAVALEPNNAYRIARWYENRESLNAAYGDVAFNWFKIAAINGHPNAIIRQARAYWSGLRVPEDKVRARSLYHIAAEKGSQQALIELEKKENQDADRASRIAEKEEYQRLRKASRAQANALAKNEALGGFEVWNPQAKQGNVNAMVRVGETYVQGNGVEPNMDMGLEWLNKAAAQGSGEAMYLLAELYSTGLGVTTDIKKAYEWYLKSAETGYVAGQYQLGLGYASGVGVQKDVEKAKYWLQKAVNNGYSGASVLLETLEE